VKERVLYKHEELAYSVAVNGKAFEAFEFEVLEDCRAEVIVVEDEVSQTLEFLKGRDRAESEPRMELG